MIIVVTGGIGSGKSSVCRILAERYGFHIYEADSKVKGLYDSHPTLLTQIEADLGKTLRDVNGRFKPSELAAVIFSDSSALGTVESHVFPALKEDFSSWMNGHDDGLPVVFESATVLEKPQFDGFGDIVVLVDAPFTTRLERAVSRDGNRAGVEARMKHQRLMNSLSEGAVDERIDHVIHNGGTEGELEVEIDGFIKKFNDNINVTHK